MHLDHADADASLRADLTAFLDSYTPSEATDEAASHRGDELLPDWARAWQATLFDHGWMLPSAPPHLGGRNATQSQSAFVLGELARRGLPRSLHFAGYGIVAPSLLQLGTPAQQAMAPAAIRGDTVWCVGMSEPNAGSDLASLRTLAEVTDGGFIISGQKVWTSFAPIADQCLCYVRTDPSQPRHAGISTLIVNMRSPGIEVRPLRNITGTGEFAEVFFDRVRVPREALLGELGGGWAVTQAAVGHERSTMWLEAVARLERVIGDLTETLLAGAQSDDPDLRSRIALAHEQVATLRALGQRSMGDQPELGLMLKLATSELYTDLVEFGLRMQGVHGQDRDDSPAVPQWAHRFLGSLAGTIAGGTSEVQRDIISRQLLHLPRR